MASLVFLLRRARQHWQVLLTLCLGVTLATALLASGPLLVDTVTEMGLYLTFQSAGVTDSNLRVVSSGRFDEAGFQALDNEIQGLLHAHLGQHLDQVPWSAQSRWIYPWVDGELAADHRVTLQTTPGIQDQLDYIAGDWPEEASDEANVIRAVVSDGMARLYVLRVGDRLPLSLEQQGTEPEAWIEVAGIVQPKNPLDPFWFGEHSPLTSQNTRRWSAQYSAIVPKDAFFPAVSTLFPGDKVSLAWHALLRHDTITSGDIEPLQAQINELDADLETLQPRTTLTSGVPDILAKFQIQLESIRVPLYILIAEVMLLVLYYVTMIAALYMRQVEREFAILRSRGASNWQIARIQIFEALVIVAVALAIGPWLGAGLVKGLSWVGPLADLEQANWSLSVSQSAWLAAGVAALACLAGLLLPLGPALRRTIVTHQQLVGRSSRPPWWQRMYLDLFLLLAGMVLLWRLRLYGGMTTGGPGGARLDWLLLLAPVALLLGAATILLRVFPVILGAFARLATRRPGLEGALALWQASRNPTHVTRLVLLLTLAIALGNLALGLNFTLDQSEYDRATYLAGNDLRLISQRAVPLVDLQSASGVLQLSGAWRGQGSLAGESPESDPSAQTSDETAPTDPKFEVLAIEPDSFSKVTTTRKDFAEEDLTDLLAHLSFPGGEHPSLLPLPGQPARFGLWLWSMPENKAELDSWQRWIDGDDDAERVGIVAKLQTAQGELFTVRLQEIISSQESALGTDRLTIQTKFDGRDTELRFVIKPDTGGWHYFDGPVPVLPPSSYPLSLHSLWFHNQATRLGEPIPKGVTLVADDLTILDGDSGEEQIVEDFESPNRTLFLNEMDGASRWYGLITYMIGAVSRSGKQGQLISLAFTRPQQTYPLRLRQTWAQVPLPALASPAFLETTQLEVGDVARVWVGPAEVDFRIRGKIHYFPTMYEELKSGYLITSRDLLLALLNDTTQPPTNPNEVLIETDGSASLDDLSAVVPVVSHSWRAESVRQALKANPLALGLRSVTFFASALTILLSLVGFGTYFYMSVRQREMQYGVMRAMGMSARQLYGSIVLEQAILILSGLALGTILAVFLNQITLPRLPVSLGDQAPIPPFVPRSDWLSVGWLYLCLGLAFLIILGIVTAMLWRARVHRILRIGQE